MNVRGACLLAADLIEELPQRLRLEREHRGLTQKAAAQQMGLSNITVSKVERGHIGNGTTAVLILRWLAGGS